MLKRPKSNHLFSYTKSLIHLVVSMDSFLNKLKWLIFNSRLETVETGNRILRRPFIIYRMIEVFKPLDAEGHLGLQLHRPLQLAAHRRHVPIHERFALVLESIQLVL